jgi:hypothetical protein
MICAGADNHKQSSSSLNLDIWEWYVLSLCSRIVPDKYEACPESKDTEVLNMYNIFNLQKQHCE